MRDAKDLHAYIKWLEKKEKKHKLFSLHTVLEAIIFWELIMLFGFLIFKGEKLWNIVKQHLLF
jgi:predicted nucleotidyltransferase